MKNLNQGKRRVKTIRELALELPSSLYYFIVKVQTKTFEPEDIVGIAPQILLVYSDEQITFHQLIVKIIEQTSIKVGDHLLELALQKGYQLGKTRTVNDVKKLLRKKSMNGVQLNLRYNDQIIYNESGLQFNIKIETNLYNPEHIGTTFYLPITNDYLYIDIKPEQYKQLPELVSKKIYQLYKKNIDPNNILLSVREDSAGLTEKECKMLGKNDKIFIYFKQNVILRKPDSRKNCFVKIIGEGVQSIKLLFDDIKDLKIQTIFKQKLGFQTMKKEYEGQGLKILDFTIKSGQVLSSFEEIRKLFNNNSQYQKVVVAQVIQEHQLFYDHLKYVPTHDSMNKFYDEVQLTSYQRESVTEFIRSRVNSTSNEVVKDCEAIFLYTSDMLIKVGEKTDLLYAYINRFLRETQFGNIQRQIYSKLNYWYINQLISQIQRLRRQNPDCDKLLYGRQDLSLLYRGVDFNPVQQIGDVMLFKGFTSTTVYQMQALNFAVKTLFVFKKCRSATPIWDYSYYDHEKEVLVRPYSQFKVTNIIYKKQNKVKKRNIDIYEMEEIPQTALKDSPILYILWVGPKRQQGKTFFDNLQQHRKTVFFIEKQSNAELKKWLQDSKKLQQDKTVEVILVTNMTRNENGLQNGQAGVESIKLFRSYRNRDNVFLFVGWVERTLQKLAKNWIQVDEKLTVSNKKAALAKFLQQKVKSII